MNQVDGEDCAPSVLRKRIRRKAFSLSEDSTLWPQIKDLRRAMVGAGMLAMDSQGRPQDPIRDRQSQERGFEQNVSETALINMDALRSCTGGHSSRATRHIHFGSGDPSRPWTVGTRQFGLSITVPQHVCPRLSPRTNHDSSSAEHHFLHNLRDDHRSPNRKVSKMLTTRRPCTADVADVPRVRKAKKSVPLIGDLLVRRPQRPMEPSPRPATTGHPSSGLQSPALPRRPRTPQAVKPPKLDSTRRPRTVQPKTARPRAKLKPKLLVRGQDAKRLSQSLSAFDVDRDGEFDLEELSVARRAMYGRAGAPFEAGSVNDVLRKHRTRKLNPQQATAQFASELQLMADQDTAEDAMWRLNHEAEKRSPNIRQVTQADFDDAWKRAEKLEAGGRITDAAMMYARAREVHGQIRSGNALEITRRIKQDLTHMLREQHAESRRFEKTGHVPVAPPEPPAANWPLPRGKHSMGA
eukprot:TRINITY_DN2467_c0_g1_i2.p1 TRINITY_DN2467_c0_g1~~TRINITY_DN2467_c0_g1_i2.p1  ORF type:complete len:467 (-),score=28.81 TRINITY_DN2467_c0_g1_i2:761-2161(-)